MSFELLVTDGIKAGARAVVAMDEPVTVGTSYNCDIVLLDPSVGCDESGPLHQAELSRQDEQWTIRVLAGSATIGDVELLRDDVAAIETNMPVNIGSSVFVIAAQTADAVQATSVQPEFVPTPPSKRRGLATATCVIAGACFLIAGVSAYLGKDTGVENSQSERPGFAAMLEQRGFGGLGVKLQSDGSYRIGGVLQTRADHIELKSLIADSGFNAQLDVKVAEVLTESVLSVYRLHGVAVDLKLSGLAEITAVSAEPNTALLDTIESRVKQDIPEIIEIVRKNVPPPVNNVDQAATPLAVELPGKRIMMVASSEPAYILTEDGARYYKGAMLPSGYKIVSIFEKTVKLERNDEVVELVF